MYDDDVEDGDTVSVVVNDHLIIDHQMIRNWKRGVGAICKVITLNPDRKNYLISKAWNNGRVGDNTLRIDFFIGDFSNDVNSLRHRKPDQYKRLHSVPGVAGGVVLKCQ